MSNFLVDIHFPNQYNEHIKQTRKGSLKVFKIYLAIIDARLTLVFEFINPAPAPVIEGEFVRIRGHL
jgi:hypothetical protein